MRPLASSILPVLLFACGDNGGTRTVIYEEPPAPCLEGTASCPCKPDNACGAGLACTLGYCAPATCTRGALDCACYPNGTCDAHDDVPMTCAAGTCRVTETAPDGELGGSCAVTPCATGLVCEDDRCDDPSCPLGALGCTCGPYGQCAAVEGQAVACTDGRCRLGSCTPGALGCSCDNGTCQSGLECANDLCRQGTGLVIHVRATAAEACDVLLRETGGTETGRRIADIRFEAHVQGEYLHRSPDLALSFISRAPGALGRAVSLRVTTAGARPTIARATCYDALGKPLTDAQVTLE